MVDDIRVSAVNVEKAAGRNSVYELRRANGFHCVPSFWDMGLASGRHPSASPPASREQRTRQDFGRAEGSKGFATTSRIEVNQVCTVGWCWLPMVNGIPTSNQWPLARNSLQQATQPHCTCGKMKIRPSRLLASSVGPDPDRSCPTAQDLPIGALNHERLTPRG